MKKYGGCQLLVAGLHRQQIEKKAFDWSRLIPWIPGVNDIRRRGTRADVVKPKTPAAPSLMSSNPSERGAAANTATKSLRKFVGLGPKPPGQRITITEPTLPSQQPTMAKK